MSKKPKKKQTEWNKQGKAIADTAAPYYQSNLTRMDEYLQDPTARMDEYINKYYTNTAERDAFMRNYNRGVSAATAYNYGATGGGYDSSNQRLYDDQQRYMNDLASRLYDKGVMSGAALANQDYSNLLAANNAYQNAYNLGKNYSDVDQYNYLRKQYNSFGNQLMGSMGTIGSAIGSIWGPAGAAIGGAAGNAIGGTFGLDDSAFNSVSGGTGGSGGTSGSLYSGQYTNQWSPLQSMIQTMSEQGARDGKSTLAQRWWGK